MVERARSKIEPLRVTRNGRRFYSVEHKRAVVEKCLAPGASVSAVALEQGFNANLVRRWMEKHRAGRPGYGAGVELLPVRVHKAADEIAPKPAPMSEATKSYASPTAKGSIEIEIGAVRVKLRGEVGGEQLRVVLEALGHRR